MAEDYQFEDISLEEALGEPPPVPVAARSNYKIKAGQIEIPGIGTIYYPLEFCELPNCPHRDPKHPFSFFQLPDPLNWWVHSGCHCPTFVWWEGHFNSFVQVTGEVPWSDTTPTS